MHNESIFIICAVARVKGQMIFIYQILMLVTWMP